MAVIAIVASFYLGHFIFDTKYIRKCYLNDTISSGSGLYVLLFKFYVAELKTSDFLWVRFACDANTRHVNKNIAHFYNLKIPKAYIQISTQHHYQISTTNIYQTKVNK